MDENYGYEYDIVELDNDYCDDDYDDDYACKAKELQELLSYWETIGIIKCDWVPSITVFSYAIGCRSKPSTIELLCNNLKDIGMIKQDTYHEYYERQKLNNQGVSNKELNAISNALKNQLPIRFEDNTFLIDLDKNISICLDINGRFIDIKKWGG